MAEIESLPYKVFENDAWDVTSLLTKQNMPFIEGTPLKDIANFNPVRLNQGEINNEHEYRYIDLSCISEEGILLTAKKMYGKDLPARARLVVNKGDILISTVRPEQNFIAVVTEPFEGCIVNTTFAVLRTKELIPEVLYFLLRSESFKAQITALSKGATVPTIKLKDLKNLEAPLNCFNEGIQKEAKKLFASWIEHNSRTKTIQEVVEEVFYKNNIINLVHEMKKRSKIYQSYPYEKLKDRLDVSFYMEKSNHEWYVDTKTLEDVAIEFRTGAPIPSKEYKDKGISYVRIKNLVESQISTENLVYVDENLADKNHKSTLSQNEILVSRVGTIGKAALVNHNMEGSLANQHLTILKVDNTKLLSKFLVYYFNTSWAVKQFERHSGGAAQQFIKLGAIKNIKVPVPPIQLQKKVINEVHKELELMDKTNVKANIERFSNSFYN